MNSVTEAIVSVLLVTGGLFTLIGAIGLVRLPDFFTRLHAPTKATTLGVGSVVLGSMVFFSHHPQGAGSSEILIMLFLFITAPVSANFLAKAAMHLKVPAAEKTRGQPWEQ